MKRFMFTARKQSGEITSGSEEAENADDLVNRLQLRGLLVTNVRLQPETRSAAASGPGIRRPQRFTHYGIKEDDMVLFCRHLATVIGSGVPLLRCLDIISKQINSRRFFNVTGAIIKDVESGLSLRDALSKRSNIFSNLWISMIETGEASGNLPEVLEKLARYLEMRAAFKRKIISALIYPIILLIVALSAVLFFLIFIVPKFMENFAAFDIDLPMATKMLILLSEGVRKNFLLILGVFCGIFFGVRHCVIKTKAGRRLFDNLILKVPIAGNFFSVNEIEKFSSTMTTLLESGVPILYSLEIAERSATNTVVQDVIRGVKDSVREGKPMIMPLEESGFFPPMVNQMVNIGEEIGELDKMFKKIASFYAEMLETAIARFTVMFEPLMIVFMGVIIGGMVISMFLPIFKIAAMGGGAGG
jgi:type IV pilus assembly protein PilC